MPIAAPALCAKLTTNMSRQQLSEWASLDIDCETACPNLPPER